MECIVLIIVQFVGLFYCKKNIISLNQYLALFEVRMWLTGLEKSGL